MRIEFNKLVLHNFLSFGDAELDIRDDGFIRVSGINQNPDDMAVSNGSGKSSLWEGIVWALTGDTIRGTKQVSNIYGEDGTYVQLIFSVDGKVYDLLRSKDSKEYKTNLRILVDGNDISGKGIRESEKILQQNLPDITASLLGSVIILGQGLPQKFTSNSPSGRKEVLETLSKSDFMIQDLKDRVSKRKSELSGYLRVCQDNIVAAESMKRMLINSIDSNTKSLNEMDRSYLDKQLTDTQSNINEYREKLKEIDCDIELVRKQRDQVVEDQHNVKLTQQNILNNVIQKYQVEINSLNIELASVTTSLNSEQNELSKLRNIKDVCPTCGQKIPGVVKPDTSEVEEKIKELNIRKSKILDDLSKTKTKQNEETIFINQEFSTKLKFLDESLSSCNTRLNSLISTKNNLDSILLQEQNNEKDLIRNIQEFESIQRALKDSINKNSSAVEDLTSKILYNNNEKEITQQHLDIQNKFDTALKRDFRGFLLLSVINYIQTRAKEYSRIIFDTDKIGFALDGNNIEISYNKKPYENLSGGEKQKVDIIVQFSIRDMLCSHLNFTSNILVLDEVFDGLDNIGCQKVLDIISSITDIKNIFIVTHRKDLSIPADRELVVVKSSNGISELKQ